MKRCPVCQRTYPDDAQNFCLDDGASLLSDSAPPQQTPYGNRAAPTQIMSPAQPTQGMGAAAPPPPVFPSYAAPRKKNALPLVIGVAGLVVVGIIVGIVFVLKGSGTSKSPDPSSWQTFNGDKFSVNMPGTPIKTEQSQTTAAGQISVKMNTVDRGSEAYVVGYTEYPSVVFDSQTEDGILNAARDGMVNNMQGKITNERAISQGSYKGKEYTGTLPDKGYSFTMQLYLTKPRMYILLFVKQGDQSISDDGRKFLDSFKITSP